MENPFFHRGNVDILKCSKTAFLCSQSVSALTILKVYDWAVEQKNKGVCVISGFHSKIENDVYDILLKGTQPLIMVLARSLKKQYDDKTEIALQNNRLLILSPFDETVTRVSRETAAVRNAFAADMADEVFIAYARQKGSIEKLALKLTGQGKKIQYLGDK